MRRQVVRQPNLPRPGPVTTYRDIAPARPLGARSVSEHDPKSFNRHQPPIIPRMPPRGTESPNPPSISYDSPQLMRNVISAELGSIDGQRKRGRPNKAEVEARNRLYESIGQTYQPKRRNKKPRISQVSEGADVEDSNATSLLQTPTAQSIEPVQETSSSRRRKHQSREETPMDTGSADTDARPPSTEQDLETSVAHSPSDRLLLSHRDRGSVGSSRSRPTQQESETLDPVYYESGPAT